MNIQNYKNHLICIPIILLFLVLCIKPLVGYQPFLSPGDHGRDLYAFEQTSQGATPYKDYWWCYGPLMPYYYGLFIKALGSTITTVQIGKLALIAIAGLFFYLTLSLITPAAFALLGSIWFMLHAQDFFFTYNHMGGITALTIITFFMFRFLKNQHLKNHFLTLLFVFILCLIKLNFGLAALFCYAVAIFLLFKLKGYAPGKKRVLLIIGSIGALPVVVGVAYIIFLNGLPIYAVRQCLPYLSSDHPHNTKIHYSLIALVKSIFHNIAWSPANVLFALIINLSFVQTLLILKDKNTPTSKKHMIIICLIIFPLFYVINIHEFLVSGVYYRLFWATVFSMYLIFTLIAFATKSLTKPVRLCLYLALAIVIFLKTSHNIQFLEQLKIPEKLISHPKAQLYTNNGPIWNQTLQETTDFLEANLKKDELFLALPYDPLLYFLMDRKSPTRQTIFFEHINIPPQQEKSIIGELEANKTNWIVISSRAFHSHPRLGTLGKDHCPILGDYIDKNFEEVTRFGDWNAEPGWAWGYALKVLKRKSPL